MPEQTNQQHLEQLTAQLGARLGAPLEIETLDAGDGRARWRAVYVGTSSSPFDIETPRYYRRPELIDLVRFALIAAGVVADRGAVLAAAATDAAAILRADDDPIEAEHVLERAVGRWRGIEPPAAPDVSAMTTAPA